MGGMRGTRATRGGLRGSSPGPQIVPWIDALNGMLAGEAAVHLLQRMLAFDPQRRMSAEEALTHEYFAAFEHVQPLVSAGAGYSSRCHQQDIITPTLCPCFSAH